MLAVFLWTAVNRYPIVEIVSSHALSSLEATVRVAYEDNLKINMYHPYLQPNGRYTVGVQTFGIEV